MSAARIRELNDAFRASFIGGRVMLTAGVSALPATDQAALLTHIRQFTAFGADSDPHHEHDFGALDVAGVRYFWKIDYYDLELTYGSPDPADPTVTTRVLTIMRADEY